MLRHFSSDLRRHVLVNGRYISPETLRVARIGNLPEGYNLADVLQASKANLSPLEQILPDKNHITLRFFNEDLAKRFCLAKSNAHMMDSAYESPVELVSAKTVAYCGLGASRKVKLTAASPLTKETTLAALSQFGDPTVTDIRLYDGSAFIDFADVNTAIKAVSSPEIEGLVDAKFVYCETSRQLRVPSFVSRASEMRHDGRRTVILSHIKNVDRVEEAVWSVVESKTSDRVLDSQLVAEQKVMVISFATAAFAAEFKEKLKPKGLKVKVHLVKSHMYKDQVSAIGMGASRTLQILGGGSQDLAQFNQFGPVLQTVQNDDVIEITYKSFWDSMNALLKLESGNHGVTGFDGASISFPKTSPVTVAPPRLPPSSEPSPSLEGLMFVAKAESLIAEALQSEA
ncbi:uncharacterized protein BT62DRAFT_1074989 [Guyanagaster necrorhizus]|uniref:Uncharacterized protein n=1 Tax=Guyanagaster necrorhizus TaxID=856835 RepID=A0A9P7VVI5_9AGAR|nr:uncharacterized protein BT62DRAFT_1074989 [Guyanagaster necrorhizus MCA 3950]KAG7447617.1 hypothetical protein BT62DRAFT_1074989 [Guyanagaster necrorhizus MCA 3950]